MWGLNKPVRKSHSESWIWDREEIAWGKNRITRIRRSLILKSKLERKMLEHLTREHLRRVPGVSCSTGPYTAIPLSEGEVPSPFHLQFSLLSQTSFRQVHASVCIWDAPSATFNRDLIRVSTSLDSAITSSPNTCQKQVRRITFCNCSSLTCKETSSLRHPLHALLEFCKTSVVLGITQSLPLW